VVRHRKEVRDGMDSSCALQASVAAIDGQNELQPYKKYFNMCCTYICTFKDINLNKQLCQVSQIFVWQLASIHELESSTVSHLNMMRFIGTQVNLLILKLNKVENVNVS